MSERNNLSVCMITYNDEQYIRDSMTQLRIIADEIIIADIGSTDHTMDIARQEGALVYPVKWNNDFSEIKNFLMDHADGRWVLFLQPNEKVLEEHYNKLLGYLDNPNAEGYLMLIDYNSEDFHISSPVQALRLLRNHKENRFVHRSFERIPDEVVTGMVNSQIEIVQLADAMQSWELNLRITLLQEEAIAYQHDCYVQYMQGVIKLNQQRPEESIAYFENATSKPNSGSLFAPHLYKCLSWAYLFLDQYHNAVKILNEGIGLYPLYTDLLILRAETYRQLQQHENAIMDIEQCMQLRDRPNIAVPAPEISDAYALSLLGETYEQINDEKKALCYYIQSYQLDSTETEVLTKIGDIVEMTGAEEVFEDLILWAVEQKNTALNYILGTLQRKHAYPIILLHMNDIAPIIGFEQAMILETCCRLMIEDIEDVDASLYQSELILRLIELSWIHGNWHKSEKLLADLKQSGICGWSIINLYFDIHHLLMGQIITEDTLEPDAYETTAAIYDVFLWKGQITKARLLLPMLLNNLPEDRAVQLALPWVKAGDFEVIGMIYTRIVSDVVKQEFIYKIAIKLLRHDYPEAAGKLYELRSRELPVVLEQLLLVSCTIQKLKRRIVNIQSQTAPLQLKSSTDLPDQGLIDFYRMRSHAGNADMDVLTVSGIHENIGDLFMTSNRRADAFSAYLKSLQEEPWNFDVQQKVLCLLDSDACLEDMLKRFDYSVCGHWFDETNMFIGFIAGLRAFYNGSFKQAKELFIDANCTQNTNLICSAYATACLWLEENQNDIVQEEPNPVELNHLGIHACFNYVIYNLHKVHWQSISFACSLEEKARNLAAELVFGK